MKSKVFMGGFKEYCWRQLKELEEFEQDPQLSEVEMLRKENKQLKQQAENRRNKEHCDLHGHDFDNWSMRDQCCLADGRNRYVCHRCGEEVWE